MIDMSPYVVGLTIPTRWIKQILARELQMEYEI